MSCSAPRTTRRAGRSPPGSLAPLNEGLIPQATLSNFAKGALNPCTVNGKVYCLRNDLSQVVLWYNATLMKKWGYQVPTTWPQYQQLGETVAKQHPGYLVGNAGDTFTPEIYMWASQCQANDITGLRTVTVNVTSPDCTRMASLLDTLVKAGSMSKLSVFSTAFDKTEKGKVLMLPGPAWFGGAVFDTTSGLNVPKGQIAVAPIPQWPGTSTPSTGNVGGGTWLLSAHSAHLKEAVSFITWVTGNNTWQDKLTPGFPAYVPAAKVWLANQAKSGYYAHDISGVLGAGGRRGMARLGLRQVQPGGRLGRHHRPGPDLREDHRLDAAGLADRDHQLRDERRLQGQSLILSRTTDPAGARAARGPRPVRAGHVFVAGYLILLAAFGVAADGLRHLLRVHQRREYLRRVLQLRRRRDGTSDTCPRSRTSRCTWSSGWPAWWCS